MTDPQSNIDASALEKGLSQPTSPTSPSTAQHTRRRRHGIHHHHHFHLRRKREAEKIQKKLPGVMQTDDADVDRLRRRLNVKNEIVAGIAEFCGTFLFLLFSFGIATQAGQQQLSQSTSEQTQNQSQNSGGGSSLDTNQLLFSSLGFGFSLAVNAWVFFRVSGGLFNPAVTLGLFISGAVTWYRAIILTFIQFVSAIAAAGVAQLITPGGINARTKLGGATTVAQGFFIEFFSTALLMFAIYMLAGEKHKATFLAPVGIGLALFLAELYATGLTGGSLNPARTLGPDVIAAQFDGTTWIYYVAPYAGVLLSGAIYGLLKVSRYETANEGQDGDDTALLLRDADGNLTGAVQKVAATEVPDLPAMKDPAAADAPAPAQQADATSMITAAEHQGEGGDAAKKLSL
ncbi:Aquaporin-1 [Tilletia horrida]|uniref:Aquaporin-1 n=1 Tax=Tilletia horrida TaxID=155126 RepID=A0AAN6GBU0_9BASI|nr:Aquaporin-1 [Tilletia horrida]KAK0529032.1 Aquaporin-1 [Tilletia horrida]KAK0533663.1 Aquaporin-1 [Tilletia horrida]KAK0561082.1 Aquaporin-1 [Tilletia horrida]